MKKLIFISFCIIIFAPIQFSQTQLLKEGNAVQYSNEGNDEWIVLTINKVEINGKGYFERKGQQFGIPQNSINHSFERIEGDSIYYALTLSNSDSLIFNYNWKVGHQFMIDSLSGQRIDSIKITDTFLKDDTLYFLRNFYINPTTGDTNFNVIPQFNHYSKKIGKLDSGLWYYTTGVKVNGVRYGEVYPFPEEVEFSTDSLYSEFIGDTVSCFIKNTSDYDVVLDSILSTGGFYGYHGTIVSSNNEMDFYLIQSYPSDWWGDTLNLSINQKDSIKFNIFDIDLCPVCKKQPDEYFEDTLRFVFSFKEGKEYSFSKIIPISGEGHPSDINDEVSSPRESVLQQNYPNPFNPNTIIRWQSTLSGIQTIKIFDVLGNEINTLIDEYKPAGNYEINFDASFLPSGVYFYRLISGSFIQTKKMVLMK